MFVYGHSAGGHLAGAMVATDWPSLYPKAPADLVPAGYSISGVFDLAPLVGISVNQDLRLDAATARASLAAVLADQARAHFRRGRRRARIRASSSAKAELIAETWRQSGAQTRYEEIAGTNHFTVIDALADPQSAMTARVAELAKCLCRLRRSRAVVGRVSNTQADAAKIMAKPTMSEAVGTSPRMTTDAMTPMTGPPNTPSDAVAAGNRRTMSNHNP